MRSAASLLAALALLVAVVLAAGSLQWPREAPYRPGERFAGPALLSEPTGIAAGRDRIYVSDARHARIVVLDHDGRLRGEIGAGALQRPMNLSLRDGRLYVADYFRDAVAIFAADGGALLDWVAPADGLRSPGGVDVFDDGSLLVADTYGQRIVHFAVDGRVLRQWQDRFDYPTDVAVTADGGFVVADGYNHRYLRFDARGRLAQRRGGPFGIGLPGALPGWFSVAAAIAVSGDGRIAVADYFNDRIQLFDGAGKLLSVFAVERAPGVRHGPMGLDFAPDGSLWAVHHALHRIERWLPAGHRQAAAGGQPRPALADAAGGG